VPQASITTSPTARLSNHREKLRSGETCLLDDFPMLIGDRNLKSALGQVNGNGSSIHLGLLLSGKS
jgi:hypothetical protein